MSPTQTITALRTRRPLMLDGQRVINAANAKPVSSTCPKLRSPMSRNAAVSPPVTANAFRSP